MSKVRIFGIAICVCVTIATRLPSGLRIVVCHTEVVRPICSGIDTACSTGPSPQTKCSACAGDRKAATIESPGPVVHELPGAVPGSVLWISFFVYAGYYFGNIPFVKKNLTAFILGVIVLSVLPGVIAWLKERRRG